MRFPSAIIIPVALMPFLVQGQGSRKQEEKPCKLKLFFQPAAPKQEAIHFRKGEKSSGYAPLITFEILESGEVTNARVKRSSGVSDIDALALDWARSARYKKRPGCGIVKSRASVVVDRR
jgi:TonB family protein